MWRSIRINAKDRTITEAPLKEEYRILGGRSLVAQVLTDEVDPKCDPVGSGNKLIIALTLLAGTKIGGGHRLSIGGKSPLTGGAKEANVGGTAAYFLAGHGIKLIIVEDIPENENLSNIHIDKDGKLSFVDASEDEGLGNYAMAEKYLEKYGDKNVSVMSIGGAGERKNRNSSIAVTEFNTGHPCRIAARGGIGAVMGSKGIKAFVMERPETRYVPDVVNKELYDKSSKELIKIMAKHGKLTAFGQIGTIANVAMQSPLGILPVNNFSGEFFPEYEKLGPATFMKNLAERGGRNDIACQPGCPVRCSNLYNGPDGKHLTSGMEYETIGLCGSNCGISDLDVVAKIDHMCDDFGMDTMEIGVGIGICMEMGKLEFGDAEGAIALVQEVIDGTEFGNILGQGAQAVGDYLGCKRIPCVKKQALAGYEPRNQKGTGITYAISPMGADHTAGLAAGTRYDGTVKQVQLYLSKTMHTQATFADSTMCLFTHLFAASKGMPEFLTTLSAMYGVKFDMDYLVGLVAKNIAQEKEFNKAAGFTLEDDKLPDFFLEEESPYTGAVFDFTQEEMETVHNFV